MCEKCHCSGLTPGAALRDCSAPPAPQVKPLVTVGNTRLLLGGAPFILEGGDLPPLSSRSAASPLSRLGVPARVLGQHLGQSWTRGVSLQRPAALPRRPRPWMEELACVHKRLPRANVRAALPRARPPDSTGRAARSGQRAQDWAPPVSTDPVLLV